MTTKHIFLDTMMYLHFRPVEDVDWPAIVGASDVVLVVPRITVQELDKHKNTHHSSKVRDRARHFLLLLEEKTTTQTGDTIRPNLRIVYEHSSPKLNMTELGLDKDSNDDLLVAAVLDYQQRTEDETLLVSDDSTPRLTARPLGVKVFRPPSTLRLPDDLTLLEKENRELRQQNQKLLHSRPILTAQFAGKGENNTHIEFRLSQPLPFPQMEVEKTMAAIRERHPHFIPAVSPRTSAPSNTVERSERSLRDYLAEATGRIIEPAEYVRANRDIDVYIGRYEHFLKTHWEWKNSRRRTILITIEVVNTGSAPAEDVDVLLHFPDGMQVFEGDAIPAEPTEPSRPTPPQTALEKSAGELRQNMARMNASLTSPLSPLPPPSFFRMEKTNSYDITCNLPRVKHGETEALMQLCLAFDSFDSAKSFGIDYQLRPANIPDPVSGRLDVIVTKDSVSNHVDC